MKNLNKAQKKAMAILMMISLVMGLHSMTTSLVGYIMTSYPDIPQTTVTSLITIPGLIGVVASFVFGTLAIKISRKFLLAVSATFSTLYFLLFTFVGDKGPFSLLIVAACLVGVSQGTAIPMINSMINEHLGNELSAKYVAWSTALYNVGITVISIVGGNIAAINGGANWYNAYYLGFIIIPVLVVFLFLMPKSQLAGQQQTAQTEAAAEEPQTSGFIPVKVFAMLGCGILMLIGSGAFVLNYSNYIINEYAIGTSAEAGFAYSIFTVAGVIGGFAYGFTSKALKKWMVPVCYLGGSIGIVAFMMINTNLAGAYICAFCLGFFINTANPYIIGQIMGHTPKKYISLSMGIFTGGMNIGMYLCPTLNNALGSMFGGGMKNSILAGLCFAAAAAVISVFLYALDKKSVRA